MENMTKQEKINHIWYYYKLHIIGGILAVILLFSFVSSFINRTDYTLNVTLLGKSINSEKLAAFQKNATSDLLVSQGKKEIFVELLQYDKNSNDQYAMASLQKFTTMLATGSIDVLILDREDYETFVQKGIFLRLDDNPNIPNLKSSGLKLVEGNVEVGGTGIYGIEADNIQSLKDTGYNTQNKIACILLNSKKHDKSSEFITWLFKI